MNSWRITTMKSSPDLIQIADWWQWQKGLRYKASSHYQAPPRWEDNVTSRDDAGRFAREEID